MATTNDSSLGGNLTVRGYTNPVGGLNVPAGSVGDAQVSAGSPLGPTKTWHRSIKVYDQPGTNNAATGRGRVHVVYGSTGKLVSFGVGAQVASLSGATATVKLLKNGTDVLSADIVLDDTTAAYDLSSTTAFTSTALVAGDVLEVQVSAVSAGGGSLAQGLFAIVIIDETPS